MIPVNLYVFISAHGPRKQDGAYGWVLEYIRANGEPDSRTLHGIGIRQQTVDRALVLEAITEALGRLSKPCDVTIFLDPAYLAETIPTPWEQGWVDRWEANGWLTAQGQEVKNADLWKNALAVLRNNHAVFTKIQGYNSYKNWIYSQIDHAVRNSYAVLAESGNSEPAENKNFVKITD